MPPMPYAQMASMMDMDDAGRVGQVLVDHWEFRDGAGMHSGVWDAEGWYGSDYDKLRVRSEGDWPAGSGVRGRAELLWERIVTRWWSLQGGARYDSGGGPGKPWAALGVQGLVPYSVDVEATLYVGSAGSLAARFKTETDFRLSQRLILQPEIEFNAYSKPDRERNQGSGLADLEAALRLRYEIRRELAPYLGMVWKHRSGETAPLLRAVGEGRDEWQWLLGVRFWF